MIDYIENKVNKMEDNIAVIEIYNGKKRKLRAVVIGVNTPVFRYVALLLKMNMRNMEIHKNSFKSERQEEEKP